MNLVLHGAVVVMLLLAATAPALAQEPIIPDACRLSAITKDASGCTLCHMGVATIRLTNFFATYIALPAIVLLVAIGGLMLIISGPSEPRRTLGKKILTSTLVGVIIVFVAWIGVDTLIKVLTGSFDTGEAGSLFTNIPGARKSGFGPWNRLPIDPCEI